MELTENEERNIHQAYEELKSLRESDVEVRKLYANMISEFRELAKSHEDLAIKCFNRASYFEDKVRSL